MHHLYQITSSNHFIRPIERHSKLLSIPSCRHTAAIVPAFKSF
jgi:hypothetical protein